MPDFNADCKVQGCEREALDSSGYCKKHKPAGAAEPKWTAERVSKLINDPALNGIVLDKITNAFNAAIEREREKSKGILDMQLWLRNHNNELREKMELLQKDWVAAEQQLAAANKTIRRLRLPRAKVKEGK